MTYRVAIVEDNATARANLRSHLLQTGDFDISSFSQGKELQAALRRQHFEIIIFDFYLGEGKTGVEWLLRLRQAQFIKPSTGIIFITSDRLPQTIGQIIDCHPDLLLIKPYNLQTLSRGLRHYLEYRRVVSAALLALDNDEPARAVEILEVTLSSSVPARLRNDVIKLKAQLLFNAGQIQQARDLYEAILFDCDRVLWAQWGKVKCLYVEGRWERCQQDLTALVNSQLARTKAFEWLASLSFEQEAYDKAEYYLDHITLSALSVPATRLKSLTYQRQERVIEGIELLQKKRDTNRGARENFNDFTFELAEFYLSIAEHQPAANRGESLSQARKLVGVAVRHNSDAQSSQKQAILMAFAAILEDDAQRAAALMDEGSMEYLVRTDSSALIVAAKVYAALRKPEKARELLAMAHDRTQANLSLAERTLHQDSLKVTEKQLGIAAEQAFEHNDTGTALYARRQYLQAMYYFYQAYKLLPETAAFGLNLLQCMVEAKLPVYRSVNIDALIQSLNTARLSSANQKRLRKLQTTITQQNVSIETSGKNSA